MKLWHWVSVGLLIALATVTFSRIASKPPPVAPLRDESVGDRIRYPDDQLAVLEMGRGDRRTIRSLIAQGQPMAFGDYAWNSVGNVSDPIWIRVDLERQLMSVFRGPDEIGATVILYGSDGKPTPAGTFKVLEMAKEHRSSLYGAEMPFMLRLTNDGVAIHASEVVEGSATHGCIGIPAGFAEKLFNVVERGDVVTILGSDT